MATIITKKTLSPFVVEDSTEPIGNAQLYAESAGNVSVYTGNTENETAATTTITGSGLNAALKTVAAGATSSSIEINADNNIILSAITIKGAVYGGAMALDAKGKITNKYIAGVSAVVNGDISITLKNTKVGDVYGGGAGYGAVSNGDVSINYFGGQVNNIYGGGYTGSVLNGDVSIFFDGTSSGKINRIYAGGNNSVVNGDAVITFTNNSGLYNNLKLGAVYGGGNGKAARVEGTSTLVFNDYSGVFRAAIYDFDKVVISGKSSVNLTQGQNKTMTGATFEFVITDETLGLQSAMLIWNSKVRYSNIMVTVNTAEAFDLVLIQSKALKTAADFNTNSIKVVNDEGENLSRYSYVLDYNYNKKSGGSVTITYKGLDLVFDGTELNKVVLSGAADEVNVIAGGKLAAGLSTGGGDDAVRLQSGSEVNGGIQTGAGADSLYIQKNAVLTGEVAMGDGDDMVSVESDAEVTSNISLGSGTNTLIVQRGASMTGTIIFANGSTNTVTVNGAVMGFSGGDATTNNTITLSGDTVKGGGVGYWTELDVYTGYWAKLDVFVVRDLVLSGGANDTVTVGNGASVNNIDLDGGNDKLIINQGANIGYDYVSAADWTTRGNAIAATINLGTGNDVLVLNTQLGDNVNVITADDGGDVLVIGADMAINDNQLLVGSTNNTLVVANGRQVTFNDVISWGNFISGNAKYDAFYLSQNAMINFGDSSVIENYTGTLSRMDGEILVLGAPTAVPSEIAPYYTAGNGVVNSALYAEVVDLADGGKITDSKVTAGEVYVHGGTSIDNRTAGFVAVEDYILVSANASVAGMIYLGYEPIHESSSGATADIAGTVGAIVGGAAGDQVNVTSGTASIGSIDLGAGEDTVTFTSGTFADADLVIANTEVIALGSSADVTVGSAAGYTDVTLGQNSKFTEVVAKTVTIGDWNTALSFADGYTVRLNGTVSADVTLNNNIVLITDNGNYFAADINLNGANTFSIQDGVQDWYDYQQFKFGTGATLGFKLGEESFFALDGFVGPDATAASIVALTEFGQNSGLGLGDWVYIQDWNGALSIVDFQNIFGSAPYAPSLIFENLNVVAGAEISGYIQLDDQDNQLVINDSVVINGDTSVYDYAAIQTLGGDDTVTVGMATINGRIETGDGDDTVALNGTTINTAINQGIPAVSLSDGDDLIALAGATVNGDIAFGAGDDVLTSTGASSVSQIIFGDGDNTVEVTGGTLTAGEISFDGIAANNTIEVGTGATFNVASPVVLSATDTNTVEIDGGTFGVEGLLALQASANNVTLANGGHIAGLGDLAMVGEVNTLELADAITGQDADTVNMLGAANFVQNAGTLTVTDSIEMFADDLNRIDNGATGSIQTDSLAMAGYIADTYIDAATADVIDNQGSLTADSVMLAASDAVELDNQGTVVIGSLMANGGLVTDAAGYQIYGSTQILVDNGQGASLTATGDVKLFSEDNTLTNDGSVQTGDLLMAGTETFISGELDAFTASYQNDINNLENGTLNAGDVSMFAYDNNIANAGSMTAGDILMAGYSTDDLTDGSSESLAATSNTMVNYGSATADSLSMAGASNRIELAGFVDTDNAGGTLNVTGDLVMGGDINFESGVPAAIYLAGENIIDMATQNAADAVQTDAVTASLSAANMIMIGEENSIDVTAAYDASVGIGANEGRILQVGAVSQSVTADTLVMGGMINRVDLGVNALADGEYATGVHLQSRLELDVISQTLDADVMMTGEVNALNLNIDLTSTQEGNLVTSGIAVNTLGDIAMTGLNNTLSATATLSAGTQSVLDVDGDVAITMDGDISMSGSGTNTINFGTVLTETPAALPGESGGVINLNGNAVEVVVNGDITMVGTDAVNMLNIGENTYYAGSVTMGEVYGDDLSAENILNVADIGNITFASLSMTAATNIVTLNGQGSIGTVDGIQGGTNLFAIGKDVTVGSPIVFRDIIDADHIGTEGYTILANTNNTVMLYGTAAGIDSSATNADDIFEVVGGLVTGDILTGSSANGDLVTVGGVTQADWDNELLNVRQMSMVDGDIVMGAAVSAGTNTLNVISSIVLDAEGNEVGFGAEVGGDATMTSASTNSLIVAGADTTPDIDGNFVRFDAQIGGDVTMTGSGNTATLSKGSIGGTVTATATVANNVLSLSEFTVADDIVLDAAEQNFLNAADSTLADVTMTGVTGNTLILSEFSAAGDVEMTATDGANSVSVANSSTGSITMTAQQLLADPTNIFNVLELSGQVIPQGNQEAPIVYRTTVTGDVSMTALTENVVRLGLEDNGNSDHDYFGCVTITGALTMAALANSVTVWAGTEISFVDGPSAGVDLDLRSLVGSIAMDGQNNVLAVNQGALGVTAGGVTLANLDADGDVIAASSNSITVADFAMMILEEDALGERQAISLGNASVNLGGVITSGEYGDIDYTYVNRDANGYETYYYEWKDTSTTDPDTAAATNDNTVTVAGKIFAGDLTMTGRLNIISVVGPAVEDPDQVTLGDYNFNVATLDVGDVAMYGETNMVVLSSTAGYNAALVADSLTMGDIVVNYATGTVKILAESNQLLTSSNTYVAINGVSMTATSLNNIEIADYMRRTSADAPDLVAADNNKLVAVPGDYNSITNPFVKAVDDTNTNTLGAVTMAANGVYDTFGNVVADGANDLDLGKNSAALDVTMTGYTNTVILAGDTQSTYYEVDPVTGAAVMDGLVQKTETVTLQAAATIEDLVFQLPADMANAAPTNTLTMGAGATAASVTSTDTWDILGVTHGAADSINMGARSAITGNVDLGYGNDTVTMGQDTEITGALVLGPGADALLVNGDATIGSIDFGTNANPGDTLMLAADATLTVNGNAAFAGALWVDSDTDSQIVFTNNSGFVSQGVNAVLNLSDETTVFGNIDSRVTNAWGDLALGAGTLSNGILSFESENATLAISALDATADTFTIDDTATVLFSDAGTWVYDATVPVTYGQPDVSDDTLAIGTGATLVLDGALNFGTGANRIMLGSDATLEVNQAWSADIAAVNASDEPVNADGQNVTQWIAADPVNNTAANFVQDQATGTVLVNMSDDSSLLLYDDVVADVVLSATDGVATISGGILDGSISTISNTVAYELNLGADVTGNLTFGSGDTQDYDVLTITADVSIGGTLNFGGVIDTTYEHADILDLGSNTLSVGSIAFKALEVRGDGTITVDTVSMAAGSALYTDGETWDTTSFTVGDNAKVVGDLNLGDRNTAFTINGGAQIDDLYLSTDATFAGVGSYTVSDVNAAANLTISGGSMSYNSLDITGNLTVSAAMTFATAGTITVDGALTLNLSTLSAGSTLLNFSQATGNSWDELADGELTAEMSAGQLLTGQSLTLSSGFEVNLTDWANASSELDNFVLKVGATTIDNFTLDVSGTFATATVGTDTWTLYKDSDSLKLGLNIA